MEQEVSIGRIVHYQSYGTPGGEHKSQPRAAIVTALRPDVAASIGGASVDLAVLNPEGMFFNRGVHYDSDGRPGTWRWPPRI